MKIKTPISKTAISTFARCPRLYKYQYIDKYQSSRRDWRMRVGIAFHAGLEMFWSTQDDPYPERVEFMIRAAEACDKEVCDEKLKVMLACYCDRWIDAKYEIVSLEKEYFGKIAGHEVIIIGDALVRDSAGNTILIESKTTKADLKPDGFYWDLDFNLQLGLYKEILKQNDIVIDRIIYDVTRVPPHKQGKLGRKIIHETSEEFAERVAHEMQKNYDKWFARRTIPLSSVEGVAEDVWDYIDIMSETIRAQHTPRNSNACKMYGRKCEFYNVCNGNETLENNEEFEERKRR
jgi:hypothetical protein